MRSPFKPAIVSRKTSKGVSSGAKRRRDPSRLAVAFPNKAPVPPPVIATRPTLAVGNLDYDDAADYYVPGDPIADAKAPGGPIDERWDTRQFEAVSALS